MVARRQSRDTGGHRSHRTVRIVRMGCQGGELEIIRSCKKKKFNFPFHRKKYYTPAEHEIK